MPDRDLEAELGPSPWEIYADEDEPWTDLDRLLKLRERFDYQYEIAHVLGATPSQISYWMGKADEHEEQLRREAVPDDLRCYYFEVCGHETPSERNDTCDCCLDLVRRADSEGVETPAAESVVERVETLYSHYEEYVAAYRADDAEEQGPPECPRCEEGILAEVDAADGLLCPDCGATPTTEAVS